MNLYTLAIEVLCVWRITHLLHAEDGPWDVVVRLRELAGQGVAGQAMDCFYCLSLWIALPIACMASGSWRETLLLWPALSGAAILLQRLLPEYPREERAVLKSQEDSHELLRRQTS